MSMVTATTMQPSLQESVRHATRSEHTALNRMIVSRLPLALAPHSSNALPYAAGMAAFSHIYEAFEETWLQLLEEKLEDERMEEIIMQLRTPHISRSERLRSDLENIQRSWGPEASQTVEQIHLNTQKFGLVIRQAIREKPHVLLAYTWTMYLALFNGGRWIVKQLLANQTSFWSSPLRSNDDSTRSASQLEMSLNPEDSEDVVTDQFLSFWYFDDSIRDDHHAESVKTQFKRNFDAASELLTEQERDDVVAESQKLFSTCGEIIMLLDDFMKTKDVRNTKQAEIVTSVLSGHNGVYGYKTHLTQIWRGLRTVIGYASFTVPVQMPQEQRA